MSTHKKQKHGSAVYSIDLAGDEYVVYIDRSGKGTCQNESAFHRQMRSEDPLMGLKASCLIGDPYAAKRYRHLLGEFTFELQLPQGTADLIWFGWDEVDLDRPETQVMTPAHTARYAKIDPVLTAAITAQIPR